MAIPFPYAPVIDTFTGPDCGPPPGENWSNIGDYGGMSRVGGRCDPGYAMWSTPFVRDCEAYIQIAELGLLNQNSFIFVRAPTPDFLVGYGVAYLGLPVPKIQLYRGLILLGESNISALVNLDWFGIRAQDTLIEAYVFRNSTAEWTRILAVNNSYYSLGGYVILMNQEGYLDNFGAGSLPLIISPTPSAFGLSRVNPIVGRRIISMPAMMGLRSVNPVVSKLWCPSVLLLVHSQSDGFAPKQVINLTQDDTLPQLKFGWLNADNDAYDLSAATVNFRMRARDAAPGVYKVDAECNFEAYTGYMTYLLDDADTDTPGEFYADLLMTLAGQLLTSEMFLIRIQEVL